MTIDRRNFTAGLGALSSLTLANPVFAQRAGPATIVSGFPAGGMGDAVSRPLAERLRGVYAPNVLVNSRVGAGGRIAAEYVKNAAPDGLTILQIPSSIMVLYPHIYKKLTFDPLTDFIPVTATASYVMSFTAGPGLPAEIRTVPDFVKWARANPKLANYGVPAAGSVAHFNGMMLQRAAGFEFQVVPYKGGAPLLQELRGGQIPVSFNVMAEVLPHIRSGGLRSLGIVAPQRTVVPAGHADSCRAGLCGHRLGRMARLVRAGKDADRKPCDGSTASYARRWPRPNSSRVLPTTACSRFIKRRKNSRPCSGKTTIVGAESRRRRGSLPRIDASRGAQCRHPRSHGGSFLRSRAISRAALWPGAPVTPPPGWAPEPHR